MWTIYNETASVPSIYERYKIHETLSGPKCPDFGEITLNNGHYAVRGHLRSFILAPVENL